MKKLIALVVVLAGIAALAVWRLAPKPHPVKTVSVKRGGVESTVTATSAGTVTAARQVRLRPEGTGRVAKILKREGARVEEGKPVLELDSDVLKGRLASAEAYVEAMKTRLEGARTWERQAEDDYRRTEKMYEPGSQGERPLISEQQFTTARWTWQDARAKTKMAEADVARAEAEAALVRIEISKAVILAPFAGTVTELEVELGETVTPATFLCEIQEVDALEIEAPVDETDYGRIETGLEARLTFDAFPGETVKGTVIRIAPKVIATREKNRTVTVTVALARDPRLSPGLSADVVIVSKREPNTTYLPTRCLRDGRFVYVAEGNHARRREVKIGVTNWDYSEVLDLPEGTKLISLLDLDYKGELDGAEIQVVADEP